jgi:AcrR family transcriptional regulator
MHSETGMWRGTTAEERSAERRAKLLQAGFELLGEGGSEGTTVRGVCARAQLNPRYFYESFEDLDALMNAVFDGVVRDTTSRTLKAIAQADNTAEAKTRAAQQVGIRHLTDDPRRIRIVFGEGSTGVLGRRRAQMVTQTAQLMAEMAARFYGIPRDDKLLVSSTTVLAGGLFELMVAWSNKRVDLTVDELIEHTTMLIVGMSGAAERVPRRGRTAPDAS